MHHQERGGERQEIDRVYGMGLGEILLKDRQIHILIVSRRNK